VNYPERFKTRVKLIYPDDFCGLYEKLENGSVFVGRILDDSSNNHITNEQILTLSKKDLKELIKQYKAQEDIYKEWCEIYQQQTNKE
jgi:hypothetical protein